MKRFNSIFWGLVIIAAGVIFLGNNFEIWNVEIFFDGWWTLFIIIPCIYGLFKKERFCSIFGIVIGILLLLAAQDLITWNIVGNSILPLILILIGLSFVFKPKLETAKVNKKGLPEYVGIFSGNEIKIKDEFKGANIVAIFGGVDLDLRNAKFKEDTVIDCVTVFGGIDIKVPDNVIVKTSGVPIFGGAENKAEQKNGVTVYVNYVCVFAGVDIK